MKTKPDKAALAKLNKVVAGAVKDAMNCHPEWFSQLGLQCPYVGSSVAKRATTQIYKSFLERGGEGNL